MARKSGRKQYKCQKVARISRNGYLNFLREYKQRYCGKSPKDMVRYGAREWNKLSCKAKERYRTMGSRLKKGAKGKARPKKRSPKVAETRKQASKCKDECGIQAELPEPCPRTSNAYLNFLRSYRKVNCGLKPQELLQKAGKQWCQMTASQRKIYGKKVE